MEHDMEEQRGLGLKLERPKTDNSTTWRTMQDKIFKEMNITATG